MAFSIVWTFHKIPAYVEFPAPGQLSKVKYWPPGQLFPAGCSGGGCTQLELTETLKSNPMKTVADFQRISRQMDSGHHYQCMRKPLGKLSVSHAWDLFGYKLASRWIGSKFLCCKEICCPWCLLCGNRGQLSDHWPWRRLSF